MGHTHIGVHTFFFKVSKLVKKKKKKDRRNETDRRNVPKTIKEIEDSVPRNSRRQGEEWGPGEVFILEFPRKSSDVFELGNLSTQ